MKRNALFCTLLLMLLAAPAAWAHGTGIEITANDTIISIAARFDTNEPMSEAQIIIYAPDNPRDPWLTGIADAEGNYRFELDPAIRGEWAITIRTAGHGEIRHVNVSRNGSISVVQPSDRSLAQTIALAATVVLALGGVAYYFRQNNRPAG